MKYFKKSVVVEAFQLGVDDEPEWFLYSDYICVTKVNELIPFRGEECFIRTPEGDMMGFKGDFIIKGIQGEIYPCKEVIFKATYEQFDPIVGEVTSITRNGIGDYTVYHKNRDNIEDEIRKKCIILQYVSDSKGSSHEECVLLNKEINELQMILDDKKTGKK